MSLAIQRLAAGPMGQTELVVANREAGYDTTMTPQALRNAVGVELRKDAAFVKTDGKWQEACRLDVIEFRETR